jgi:signal transduction histidine kinase
MVEESKDYLQKRLSSNVRFILSYDPEAKDSVVRVSVPLMSWVIENLTKNGVDAMSGKGTITYHISKQNGKVVLEVSDTGKGITRKNQKKVFQAGFTTKARGWGLGLALTKRIVENYHNGKIFIKHSEAGKGTTFKIVFPENQED